MIRDGCAKVARTSPGNPGAKERTELFTRLTPRMPKEGAIVKFRIYAKKNAPLDVVFEPLAEEYVIPAGGYITVEWDGDGDNGIAMHDDHVAVWDTTRGTTRAWTQEGDELMVV